MYSTLRKDYQCKVVRSGDDRVSTEVCGLMTGLQSAVMSDTVWKMVLLCANFFGGMNRSCPFSGMLYSFGERVQSWKDVLWPWHIPAAFRNAMIPSRPSSTQSRMLWDAQDTKTSAYSTFIFSTWSAVSTITRKLRALAGLWQKITLLRSRFGSRQAQNCELGYRKGMTSVRFHQNWFHLVELLLEADGRCARHPTPATCPPLLQVFAVLRPLGHIVLVFCVSESLCRAYKLSARC